MREPKSPGERRLPPRLGLGSEERLARRAAQGDERAFAAIFHRYSQPLYRYCLAIVGNPADAQDALQNTMVKALRALPGERREVRLRAWLYRVAHNEAVEILRRRREAEELDPEAAAPGAGLSETVERRQRLRGLLADLEQLPERQHGALVMRELAGLGFEEIGTALGTSAAVARQTVYEARLSLRQMEAGREMSCDAVTRALSDADGRTLRRRDVRAHLRACPECRAFRAEIEDRRGNLAALSPLPAAAAAALLKGAFGSAAAGVGGGAAGVGGGAAGVGASAAGVGGSAAGVGGSAAGVGGSAAGATASSGVGAGVLGGGGGAGAAGAGGAAGTSAAATGAGALGATGATKAVATLAIAAALGLGAERAGIVHVGSDHGAPPVANSARAPAEQHGATAAPIVASGHGAAVAIPPAQDAAPSYSRQDRPRQPHRLLLHPPNSLTGRWAHRHEANHAGHTKAGRATGGGAAKGQALGVGYGRSAAPGQNRAPGEAASKSKGGKRGNGQSQAHGHQGSPSGRGHKNGQSQAHGHGSAGNPGRGHGNGNQVGKKANPDQGPSASPNAPANPGQSPSSTPSQGSPGHEKQQKRAEEGTITAPQVATPEAGTSGHAAGSP